MAGSTWPGVSSQPWSHPACSAEDPGRGSAPGQPEVLPACRAGRALHARQRHRAGNGPVGAEAAGGHQRPGAGGDGGFSFSADLGVALLDPEVSFDAVVNAGGTNGYTQAELDAILVDLENDAEDELDDYELWPVAAIGINYAF